MISRLIMRAKPSRSLKMEPLKHLSPGACIFCLKALPSDAMTAEHIIPKFLSGVGEWIIENGSCTPCNAHANHAYEQPASNADFLVPRVLLDLKRRKRSGGPKRLPHVAGEDALYAPKEVFVQRSEAGCYLPIYFHLMLPVAGRLCGEERGGNLDQPRIGALNLGLRRARVSDVTTRTPIDHTAFAMCLAKMAYCFAVVKLGLHGFDGSDIRDLLCGTRSDIYNFVGGHSASEHLSGRHLHAMYLRERGGWFTVLVHLFASFGCGAYEVVIAPRAPQ
jgi:hypothetical protein